MGRITKDDRCLIKGLRTEKNMGEEQTPNKRVSEQHYNLACIFFLLRITVTFVVAYGSLTCINQTSSVHISSSVCFTR